MTAKITELIDKQDNFELISLKIATILKEEIVEQQVLATAAGKDPTLWDLRVFQERFNPWEQFLNEQDDRSPLINVWFDSESFNRSASDVVSRQRADGVFNIDCYGFGESASDGGSGHTPGDLDAARTVHRAIRLVRNILMAGVYTYLDMRGVVGGRFPNSVTAFQPESQNQTIQKIMGARLALQVSYNEFSPQYVPEISELGTVTVTRESDGEILVVAEYPAT